MGETARSLIVHQVPPLDKRLRLLCNVVGPTLSAFDTPGFGVSRCEKTGDFHPSNSRVPIFRLDLALCVAGSDDPDLALNPRSPPRSNH
jgi:hypothetical protein